MTLSTKDKQFLAYFILCVALVVTVLLCTRIPNDDYRWREWATEKPADSRDIVARYANGDELEAVAIYSKPLEMEPGIYAFVKRDDGTAECRGDPVEWHYKK